MATARVKPSSCAARSMARRNEWQYTCQEGHGPSVAANAHAYVHALICMHGRHHATARRPATAKCTRSAPAGSTHTGARRTAHRRAGPGARRPSRASGQRCARTQHQCVSRERGARGPFANNGLAGAAPGGLSGCNVQQAMASVAFQTSTCVAWQVSSSLYAAALQRLQRLEAHLDAAEQLANCARVCYVAFSQVYMHAWLVLLDGTSFFSWALTVAVVSQHKVKAIPGQAACDSEPNTARPCKAAGRRQADIARRQRNLHSRDCAPPVTIAIFMSETIINRLSPIAKVRVSSAIAQDSW